MYLYESHLGGIYSTVEPETQEELYCETCGDWDWEIGEYESNFEAWCLLMPKTDIFGTGGFSLQSVYSFFTGIPCEELEDWSEIELLTGIESVLR